MRDIDDELRDLAVLRRCYDHYAEIAEEAQRRFKTAQAAVFRRMEDENAGTRYLDGVRFTPASTTYHVMQNRQAFVEWAKTNEPELIEQRERKGLCNAKARECIDNNEAFPPGLGSYDREYISISR